MKARFTFPLTKVFRTYKDYGSQKSFKKQLQITYLLIIGIMIIPTIYSITVSFIHTRQYDRIITNVSRANVINQIAKNDLPNELWEIVCGKTDFYNSSPYAKIQAIFSGIAEMQEDSNDSVNSEKLEVAYRAAATLKRNVEMLEKQMMDKSSVAQNQASLEEIRTITALFSDIMQDFILSEIELANETNQSIRRSNLILSILQGIIILFSVLVSLNGYITVSKGIRKPLEDMEKLSTEISEGNLEARTRVPEIEELVPLANNMNLMAQQIDVLIRRNIEEQKSYQKAEMKALQAQITPHFLYNTFDTIVWLAEEGETDKVIEITKAFSDFLRISLSKGHEWITVGQEISHIKNYLTIQKIRYADILNYEIDVDDSISECRIIKLVLQPLVENAIYHGIKNKRGRGHLKVEARALGYDRLQFTVSDDGAGFTAERLAEVKRELMEGSGDPEKLTTVYGLYNVHKKLKLYYGDNTKGLEIESEEGKGCTIRFEVLKNVEEENV